MKLKATDWYKIVILSLTIVVIGVFVIRYFTDQKDKYIKQEFLTISKSITEAVKSSDLYKLTPEPSTRFNSEYIQIKRHLEAIVGSLKGKGLDSVYSMVKKNGQIVFILDSTLEADEPVVPGDPYEKPPVELPIVFNENKTVLTNPYTDEWGKYISVFIPVNDPKTNDLVTVMGFDIKYDYWQQQVSNETFLVSGIVVLLWILVLGIYFYILTLKTSFAALKKNSESFSNIINFAIDSIIVTDLETRIIIWNKASERLFGYLESEVLGKNINQIILPKKEFVLDKKDNQIFEIDLTAKDGSNIVTEVSTTLMDFKDQKSFFLIIRDIGVKKEGEADLVRKTNELENTKLAIVNVLEDVEKEKAKSDALLSGIGDGVVAIDKDFNVIFSNKIVEDQLGWKQNELIGNKFYEIVKSVNSSGQLLTDDQRPFYISLNSKTKVTTSVNDPNYFIKKDGNKIPVAITATPVILKDEVIGVIGVFRDITHEIEVDKMKSEFVSLVSHQLRTPLSAMRWYAEMLLNGDAGPITDDQKDFIDNIYKSNERMISLVNSLLNISRIESGRIIIEPKPTDLKVLIDEVMKEVKNKFDEKKQIVLISVHPDLNQVVLDPKLIFQVYKNLLTNANKYTPDNGQIEIFVSRKDDEVVSRVTDNGYGISAKDQSKIFEKFHRAENILKLETDGTGLGLYLAKAIVESSGGKIWFESEENKGTTFWFTLPIKGVPRKEGEVSLTN